VLRAEAHSTDPSRNSPENWPKPVLGFFGEYRAILSKTNPATLIAVGITPGTFNYRLTAAALGTCAMSEETFGALQFSGHFLADLRRSSFKVSPAAVQPWGLDLVPIVLDRPDSGVRHSHKRE
jgi:hypothetical protein